MMEKLAAKGEAIAQNSTQRVREEIKSALREELPGHATIVSTAEGVEIMSPRLSDDLANNSSIRDVAFLLRGVR